MSEMEEQEMEIEALFAILMDDIKEVEPSDANLKTSGRCFEITVSPMGDDEDEPTDIPVRLALAFSHTPKYPEEPPLLSVRSQKGVMSSDIAELQKKLEDESVENLGMAMMYTLATTAKEWLREKYGQNNGEDDGDNGDEEKEEVIVPHGLPVTEETFGEWREAYEAEIALERAKLLPDSVVAASKEKKLTGRQWFESGRHMSKGASRGGENEVMEEDEVEFDEEFDDDDVDEDEMLEHYLGSKETTA